MQKFKKKPVVIEAFKFDPFGKHKKWLPDGVIGIPSPGADNWGYQGCTFYIGDLESHSRVNPGDWLIKSTHGRIYPCDPKNFEKT